MEARPADETPGAAPSGDGVEIQRFSPWWYYPSVGLILGIAIIMFAVLPGGIGGASLVLAAVVVGLIGGLARRSAGGEFDRPMTPRKVGFLGVLAIALLGSLVLVWMVVRPDGVYWLAWLLGTLVAVVTLGGTWIMRSGRAA